MDGNQRDLQNNSTQLSFAEASGNMRVLLMARIKLLMKGPCRYIEQGGTKSDGVDGRHSSLDLLGGCRQNIHHRLRQIAITTGSSNPQHKLITQRICRR
jgi:hypothetical protein